VKLPILESLLPSNDEHLRRSIQRTLELCAERIGVFGLAFKENTDDLRDSPAVVLVERLVESGRAVRVFDPHIQLDGIYGRNRDFLLSAIPQVRDLMQGNLEDMLAWAEAVVLTQSPDEANLARISDSGVAVLDLTGTLRTQDISGMVRSG
jgi:GDP-mannose 6-dehydrogenase